MMRNYLLDEVGGVGNVVDHAVDLLVGGRIDVGQQPVVEDIGLDPPGESQSTVFLSEVDQAGFRVLLGARGSLERVGLGSLGGLGLGISGNGQL